MININSKTTHGISQILLSIFSILAKECQLGAISVNILGAPAWVSVDSGCHMLAAVFPPGCSGTRRTGCQQAVPPASAGNTLFRSAPRQNSFPTAPPAQHCTDDTALPTAQPSTSAAQNCATKWTRWTIGDKLNVYDLTNLKLSNNITDQQLLGNTVFVTFYSSYIMRWVLSCLISNIQKQQKAISFVCITSIFLVNKVVII